MNNLSLPSWWLGVGVSLMPGCVRSFRQPGAVFLPLRPVSPAIDLMLVRPREKPSPTANAFVDLVRPRLPQIRAALQA